MSDQQSANEANERNARAAIGCGGMGFDAKTLKGAALGLFLGGRKGRPISGAVAGGVVGANSGQDGDTEA